MADDGNPVRRRGEAPERFEYRQALENLRNFVDNELGNGRVLRPRPDDRGWRVQRAKTIETLNELRRKLDTVCVGANYGKATGNITEIAGAAANVVGVCMALGGVNAAPLVQNIGNLVHHSGTLIDGVSGVVESLVSANYLGQIEEALKKDQELSRPLAEWLDFSRDLDANIQEIFGVSLASVKFNTVVKVFYEFSKFSSSAKGFDATMNLMRQGKYSLYIGNDVKLEKLQKFFQHLSIRPEFANEIRYTLSVLSVSVGSIQVVRDGAQAYRSIMGISDSAIPSLRGGANLEIPTAGAVAGHCAFQAISIAVSVLSLINAASIIRNGTSQYSDALKQVTRSLAWELRRMEDF